MSAKLQSSSEKLAKKLLADYGGTCVYTVVIPESTDQTTGDTIPASSTPYTISTYKRNTTLEEIQSSIGTPSAITATQKVFLIEAKSISQRPSTSDTIEMNGENLVFSQILKSVSGGQTDVLFYVVFGV